MITEYVLFDVPADMSREQIVDGMTHVAPKWRANKNLIRKTFVYDPHARQAGAFYLWHRRADAEAAHDDAWRAGVRKTFGGDPVIRYFETPVVVDNALGSIVMEDAAP